MGDFNIGEFAIWFVVFLLSLSVHECCHALAAELSGDSTGRYMGRITLNPIPHIDPVGTVILPIMMYVMSAMGAGGMMFGWAKPVPFDPSKLRDKRTGEIFIAIAGPLGNVILIILFGALYILVNKSLWLNSIIRDNGLAEPVGMILSTGIILNIVLAVFNMIPIPPLDGHHVLRNLLPDSLAEKYAAIPPIFGFLILMVLINTGFTSKLISPFINLVSSFLNSI